MSTQQLLAIVKERGLRIEIKDGQPILKRPDGNQNVTDGLLKVLKFHRERIIQELSR
jgi:hypothetical protein